MPFTVSPGVLTREIDLTTVVPTIATTQGGFSGPFLWGPIEDPARGRVSTVSQLDDQFYIPDESTFVSYYSCANFLSYGGTVEVSRIANTSARNASTANTTYGATQEGATVLIKNQEGYEVNYDPSTGGSENGTYGPFVAKWAGQRGNALKISICGPDKESGTLTGSITIDGTTGLLSSTDANFYEEVRDNDTIWIGAEKYLVNNVMNTTGTDTAYVVQTPGASSVTAQTTVSMNVYKTSGFESDSSAIFGTISVAVNSKSVDGTGTFFTRQVQPGDFITVTDDASNSVRLKVASIASDTALTLVSKAKTAVTSKTFNRQWEYACSPGSSQTQAEAPTTSQFCENIGASNDEVHIVIVDETGMWGTTRTSSTAGTQIQKYFNVSVAKNSPDYYKNKLNNDRFVWFMSHPSGSISTKNSNDSTESSWGSNAAGSVKFPACGKVATYSFNGGIDGLQNLSNADYTAGWDKFKEASDTSVSVLFAGEANSTVASHIITNVAEYRKDCMAFVSPEKSDVVGNADKANAVVAFRNALPSSSYGVVDSGWKKQFDRHNQTDRFIPLNADIAGLTVLTSETAGAFFSPAGFSRGNLRNVGDLAWNPSSADRDKLYTKGINSVVRFPGQGTVLFGDKTLLSKPNAFDRINVRQLFITLEKSISQAAEQALFEFNDDFTRSQFVSIVDPFLRDIQARGGITDFLVVCDESNNTPQVIDSNQFVGAIYVKPARSINFVELSFVAVRTGVAFNEVVQ
mgnify:FL=1|tara:strand:+ start:8503 stop:10740 length:2238 start_codon:yes stop_codon:yes gene_type:complete